MAALSYVLRTEWGERKVFVCVKMLCRTNDTLHPPPPRSHDSFANDTKMRASEGEFSSSFVLAELSAPDPPVRSSCEHRSMDIYPQRVIRSRKTSILLRHDLGGLLIDVLSYFPVL